VPPELVPPELVPPELVPPELVLPRQAPRMQVPDEQSALLRHCTQPICASHISSYWAQSVSLEQSVP
jgi:hypothetical protein